MGDGESGGDDYTIRFYEPSERDGFLGLYRSVMGPATEAWFRWKYEENPYVAHVPVVVAVDEADGVVAARPQVPFRMQAGGTRTLALRFGDTIVHEDHRRRGLFTRTTAFAMDYYSGQQPRFAFNFPNSLSEPGYRNVGGELVQELVTHYRVHDLGSVLGEGSLPVSDGLADVGTRLVSAARAAERTIRRVDPDGSVVRYEEPPAERLAELASRSSDRRVHAVRDAAFFRWRFANPRWSYDTYILERGATQVAALVAGTATTERGTVTNLMEPVPLPPDGRETDAMRTLLAAVVEDLSDSDLVAVAGGTIDPSLLRRFGFLPDDRRPLSLGASPSRQIVYDLADAGEQAWRVGGLDIREPENWALTFSEHDSR
ncbi:GNAT family N-acetyltransferase [Haloarchaeobius litoreus]|uniref:GNAT family N-acetyltransferase n=1 Tax=Haloarchaeobius litoreus TaxID=755306 RepID=A0ABD6DNZ6_9EURY|nr:GNAT family N-acetyltransferase [Haloarchaeobius litoreus]